MAQKDVHFAAALAQCKHGVQNLKGLYRSFINWFRFNYYYYLKQIILNHKHFCRIENNMLFSRATSILISCLTTALISGHLCLSRNWAPQNMMITCWSGHNRAKEPKERYPDSIAMRSQGATKRFPMTETMVYPMKLPADPNCAGECHGLPRWPVTMAQFNPIKRHAGFHQGPSTGFREIYRKSTEKHCVWSTVENSSFL